MTHSVHLSNFPEVEKQAINTELSDAMSRVQKIVSLGLSRRAKKKIRVRQPLQSITISQDLEDHFREIILDELNVKEILIDSSINSKVTKICKPDARKLGPKYGKDVQLIIHAGKAGEFTENDDGTVQIEHRLIQPDEYEFDYLKTDDTLDVEAADGMVIAMDGDITPELEAEGYARDFVRIVQDARKEADYNIEDRIQLTVNSGTLGIETTFADYLTQETLSTLVASLDNPDLQKEVEVGGVKVVFAIKR